MARSRPTNAALPRPGRWLDLLLGGLTLGWPWLVGHAPLGERGWPWLAGLILLAAWRLPRGRKRWAWLAALPAGLMAASGNADTAIRLWPVAVNAALLALFAASLYRPPTLIERLARRQTPDLPASGVRYTRRVTWLWCGFFAVNGTLALATVIHADPALWTLYNGGIAYAAMALLFTGEWCVRQRVKQKSSS
ncbi:hypothetical protein [Modicisalibacter coralii]|uniref:COG4648 family protein n=1 Tax=Modicisalibacter coralii TaxID=2304602 RepID=UPI00100BA901|nr:hypothetical protein [Halomonas coralii]